VSGNVIGYARVSTRDNPWILKWMHSWLQGPCVYFRSTPNQFESHLGTVFAQVKGTSGPLTVHEASFMGPSGAFFIGPRLPPRFPGSTVWLATCSWTPVAGEHDLRKIWPGLLFRVLCPSLGSSFPVGGVFLLLHRYLQRLLHDAVHF